ncbi:MAG: four helix bundle protein [Hyphomonadaceae bacterium]
MTGIVRTFEDLDVFQRAYELSLDIHRASLALPKVEQYALADQMRRASKSICANVAEGFGRQRASSAEFKRFLNIAVGSCDEMRVWVRYASDLGYVEEEAAAKWRAEYVELAKMLRGLAKNWS